MEFLGVGPWELFLVLVIALVVVGPERLPVLARQGGKLLVTVRDWVQKSPDAAMILRAREEIEQELANLRSSLAEVQSARDEVVEAAKQLNTVVTQDIIAPTRESLDMISQPGTVARATKPNGLPANGLVESTAAVDAVPAPDEAAIVAPDGSTLIESVPADTHATIAPPRPHADVASQDIALVLARLDTLSAELHLLQADLVLRGVLDAPITENEPALAAPSALEDVRLADQIDAESAAHENTRSLADDATPQSPIGEERDDVEQPVYSRD